MSARAYAAEAVTLADAALAAALAGHTQADGTIDLINARDSSGPALVEANIAVPATMFAGTWPLRVLRDATELVVDVQVVDPAADPLSCA